MSDQASVMRDLRAEVEAMLTNAARVKGNQFANLASYALTVKQVLREHARMTSAAVQSEAISKERGAYEGDCFCHLINSLFQAHLSALGFDLDDDQDGGRITEALGFADALYHRIELAEERMPD